MAGFAVVPSIRPLFLRRVVDGVVVLAGFALLIVGWRFLQQTQAEVRLQQARVDAAPQAQSEYIQLQQSLERYHHDLQRVTALLTPAEAVGDLVGQLEREAAAHRITMRIPDIKEEVKLDDSGQPVVSTGPFQEVRVTMLAVGEPVNLLSFVHAVEHLPVVLRFAGWELTVSRTAAARAIVPTPVPPEITPTPEADDRRAVLQATMIVTLLKPL